MVDKLSSSDDLTVRTDPTLEVVMAVVRYVITAIGGLMVSKGTISGDDLQLATGGLMTVIPTAFGVVRAIKVRRKMVRVASAPNSAITFK